MTDKEYYKKQWQEINDALFYHEEAMEDPVLDYAGSVRPQVQHQAPADTVISPAIGDNWDMDEYEDLLG